MIFRQAIIGLILFATSLLGQAQASEAVPTPHQRYQKIWDEVNSQQSDSIELELFRSLESHLEMENYNSIDIRVPDGEMFPYSVKVSSSKVVNDPYTGHDTLVTSYVELFRQGQLPEQGKLFISRNFQSKSRPSVTVVLVVEFKTDKNTQQKLYQVIGLKTLPSSPGNESMKMKALGNSSGAGG